MTQFHMIGIDKSIRRGVETRCFDLDVFIPRLHMPLSFEWMLYSLVCYVQSICLQIGETFFLL